MWTNAVSTLYNMLDTRNYAFEKSISQESMHKLQNRSSFNLNMLIQDAATVSKKRKM